jgi:hypothetical protein
MIIISGKQVYLMFVGLRRAVTLLFYMTNCYSPLRQTPLAGCACFLSLVRGEESYGLTLRGNDKLNLAIWAR